MPQRVMDVAVCFDAEDVRQRIDVRQHGRERDDRAKPAVAPPGAVGEDPAGRQVGVGVHSQKDVRPDRAGPLDREIASKQHR